MSDGENDRNAGIDRRGALECMIWAGTGVLWTLSRRSAEVARPARRGRGRGDCRQGFHLPADQRQPCRLRQAGQPGRARHAARRRSARSRRLPQAPAFMIHTGDITHLSKPDQFDDADQVIGGAGLDVHYVPGEHDYIDEGRARPTSTATARARKGAGWYSFDDHGVHFIGLVNVVDLKAGGLGTAWRRPARLARRRPRRAGRQHADRRLRAHPALDRLCRLGLGHRRRHASADAPEAVRLGDGAQRAHPPDRAEGRRQHDLPHRTLDRVSAAGAGTRQRGQAR